jgi:hypothetical protein
MNTGAVENLAERNTVFERRLKSVACTQHYGALYIAGLAGY